MKPELRKRWTEESALAYVQKIYAQEQRNKNLRKVEYLRGLTFWSAADFLVNHVKKGYRINPWSGA